MSQGSSDSEDDKPFIPRMRQESSDGSDSSSDEGDNANKKKSKNKGKNLWLRDCYDDDGYCIFCNEVLGHHHPSITPLSTLRPTKKSPNTKRYQVQRFDIHLADPMLHGDIGPITPHTLITNLRQKALVEKQKQKNLRKVDPVTALIYFLCDKGLPTSLVEDQIFRNFCAAIIAHGSLPITSAKTVAEKRAETAAIHAEEVFDHCKNKYVDLQLDVGTRHKRFLAVTVRVHDRMTSKVGPLQYDAPTPTGTIRTFLLHIRCDGQSPFTEAAEVIEVGAFDADGEDINAVLNEEDDDLSDSDSDGQAPPARARVVPVVAAATAAAAGEEADELGKISAAKIAEYLYNFILKRLFETSVVLNICTDNGSNFRALRRALAALGVTVNDVRCFAHNIQLVGLKLFGKKDDEQADIPVLNNAMRGALNFRKNLRTLHQFRNLPEPVITRWNSYYKLICEIIDKIVVPYEQNPTDPAYADCIDTLKQGWPVQRSKEDCIGDLKKFKERVGPLAEFTDTVQSAHAVLGVGVAALSKIFLELKSKGYAYFKPLKQRLFGRTGCFMTDPVLLYIALLPWNVGTSQQDLNVRETFLNHVSRLLFTVDPLVFKNKSNGPNQQRTAREALRASFQIFRQHIKEKKTFSKTKVYTAKKFEEVHRLNLGVEGLREICTFALCLSRMCVSEAAVERVFSKLKYIMNDLKAATSAENVIAQLQVALRRGFDGNNVAFDTDSPAMVSVIDHQFIIAIMKMFNDLVSKKKIELPAAENEVDVADEESEDEVEVVEEVIYGETNTICTHCDQLKKCLGCPGKSNGTRCANVAKYFTCKQCRTDDGEEADSIEKARCNMCS